MRLFDRADVLAFAATRRGELLRPTVIDQALALAFEDLAPPGSDRTRDNSKPN
jgi:hypothetical protein